MANRHRLSQRHQLTKVSILTFKNGGCILVYSPGLSISTIILDPITLPTAQMLILSAKHHFRTIQTAAKTTLTSTYFMTRLQAFFLNRNVLNSRATFDLTSWFAWSHSNRSKIQKVSSGFLYSTCTGPLIQMKTRRWIDGYSDATGDRYTNDHAGRF